MNTTCLTRWKPIPSSHWKIWWIKWKTTSLSTLNCRAKFCSSTYSIRIAVFYQRWLRDCFFGISIPIPRSQGSYLLGSLGGRYDTKNTAKCVKFIDYRLYGHSIFIIISFLLYYLNFQLYWCRWLSNSDVGRDTFAWKNLFFCFKFRSLHLHLDLYLLFDPSSILSAAPEWPKCSDLCLIFRNGISLTIKYYIWIFNISES